MLTDTEIANRLRRYASQCERQIISLAEFNALVWELAATALTESESK